MKPKNVWDLRQPRDRSCNDGPEHRRWHDPPITVEFPAFGCQLALLGIELAVFSRMLSRS
jgi:hypothetical protein